MHAPTSTLTVHQRASEPGTSATSVALRTMSAPDTTDRRHRRARNDLTAAASLLADARRAFRDAERSGDEAAIARAASRVAEREQAVHAARAEADLSHFLMMTSAERRRSLRLRINAMTNAEHPDLVSIAAAEAALAALDVAAEQIAYAATEPTADLVDADGVLRVGGVVHPLRLTGGELHGAPLTLPYIYAPGVDTGHGALTLRPGLGVALAVRRTEDGGYSITRTITEH